MSGVRHPLPRTATNSAKPDRPDPWRQWGVQLTALICLTGLLTLDPQFKFNSAAASLSTDSNTSSRLADIQFSNHQGMAQPTDRVMQRLATADVIYLGETHNKTADHIAQLQLIQALHQRNPNLILGMEMFQRPYQPALDQYRSGQISEAALLDRTEYKTRWGFDWSNYAPIVRYAKAQDIPIVALNTPTEITRKVSRAGLSSLNLAERRFIPPLSAIKPEPSAYRTMLQRIFQGAHHGHGQSGKTSDGKGFERFFQAQVLWDETMAEVIAQQLTKALPTIHLDNPADPMPKPQIVVLVGQGHVVYRYGIPWRVQRRLRQDLQQAVILLSPSQDWPKTDVNGTPIGDLLRLATP